MQYDYIVCVVAQQTVRACYGPFYSDREARDFIRVFLDHESNVQITRNYGVPTLEQYNGDR